MVKRVEVLASQQELAPGRRIAVRLESPSSLIGQGIQYKSDDNRRRAVEMLRNKLNRQNKWTASVMRDFLRPRLIQFLLHTKIDMLSTD